MKWRRAKTLNEWECGRFFIYHYQSHPLGWPEESYWHLHVDDVFVEEFKLLRDAKVAAERMATE